jgi:hypothetical protein
MLRTDPRGCVHVLPSGQAYMFGKSREFKLSHGPTFNFLSRINSRSFCFFFVGLLLAEQDIAAGEDEFVDASLAKLGFELARPPGEE